jgi:hypothetical protein
LNELSGTEAAQKTIWDQAYIREVKEDILFGKEGKQSNYKLYICLLFYVI